MTAPPSTLPTPLRLLLADLQAAPFQAGDDRGWWRLRSLEYPYAVFEVCAATRPGSPDAYAFRFDVTAYPAAPTAQLWDAEAAEPLPLHRWPKGGPRQQVVFNPGWRLDALYCPMDRQALVGHDNWLTQYACDVWNPDKDITQYLRLIHDLLNEDGYTGAGV